MRTIEKTVKMVLANEDRWTKKYFESCEKAENKKFYIKDKKESK